MIHQGRFHADRDMHCALQPRCSAAANVHCSHCLVSGRITTERRVSLPLFALHSKLLPCMIGTNPFHLFQAEESQKAFSKQLSCLPVGDCPL